MNKNILLAIVAVSAGLGWFGAKYHYSQATSTSTVVEKNHTQTVIVTVKKPNGEVRTTETIDSHTNTHQTESIKIPVNTAKTNVGLLVANDFTNSIPKLIYGVSVSKELLGPITIGVFGYADRRIGVSIGLNF